MTTCVIITTYNGMPYIEDQLESIRLQTIRADAVIISDDGSTDGTVRFVEQYISNHQLNNWELVIRTKNLGWKRNFIETMKLSNADILLLADQDDIWEADKIERYVTAFADKKAASVIVSNYSVFFDTKDETQQEFNRQTKGMINDGMVVRWPITKQFHITDRPGCVYGVRNDFFKSIVGFYPDSHPHDSFIWLASISEKSLFLLQSPLIKYRRHANNAMKKKSLKTVKLYDRIEYIRNEREIVRAVKTISIGNDLSSKEKKCVDMFEPFCERRLHLFETRNPMNWFILCIKYRGFYSSCRSLLADLVLSIRGK